MIAQASTEMITKADVYENAKAISKDKKPGFVMGGQGQEPRGVMEVTRRYRRVLSHEEMRLHDGPRRRPRPFSPPLPGTTKTDGRYVTAPRHRYVMLLNLPAGNTAESVRT